jgi:4-hydroxybutyrate CoA-transferase
MYAEDKLIRAEEAAQLVTSGSRIFFTGNCATPQAFNKALIARHAELHDVEVVQLLDFGPPYITPDFAQHIRMNCLFIGPNMRKPVNEGLADFTPIFLSEIPGLFRTGRLPIDIAVIQVSPPDDHGYCSYGIEVSITKAAAESARLVIAEINPNMPRSLGDSFIHMSRIDHWIAVDYALPEVAPPPPSPVQDQIAEHIIPLIPDAATLQTGIGGIPDAVLRHLTGHKNLGIHTELCSDGVMEMIERGVITNAKKSIHPGKVVAGFAIGTHNLYKYMHDNPIFEMHPTEYVNDPFVISQNRNMISINSALEVDITGQVCADSIGPRFYSGVGGQLDFVRGASRAKGGLSIIALPSTAKDDTISRISMQLPLGAGVTTTRNDVHVIATEYGIADLYGKSIQQRVMALTNIAHPNFREPLLAYAREQKYLPKVYTFA